jgi:hypothetical protein
MPTIFLTVYLACSYAPSPKVLHSITRILYAPSIFCRISAVPPVKRYLNARDISKVICAINTKYRTKSSSSALHYNPLRLRRHKGPSKYSHLYQCRENHADLKYSYSAKRFAAGSRLVVLILILILILILMLILILILNTGIVLTIRNTGTEVL